ncbi:MAG: hypothetical protein WDM87_16160 [Terracidiphilus sp.]
MRSSDHGVKPGHSVVVGEIVENFPSGAKAHIYFEAINGTTEVVPLQNDFELAYFGD